MALTPEEAKRAAEKFVANANAGDHVANDRLVRDLDDRPAVSGTVIDAKR